MKRGKAAGMKGIGVEILKCVGVSVVDWLLRIFNRCMELGVMSYVEGLKAYIYYPVV